VVESAEPDAVEPATPVGLCGSQCCPQMRKLFRGRWGAGRLVTQKGDLDTTTDRRRDCRGNGQKRGRWISLERGEWWELLHKGREKMKKASPVST